MDFIHNLELEVVFSKQSAEIMWKFFDLILDEHHDHDRELCL
jgi:hypothetical protein